MTRKRSKRKAVREDRPMLLSRRESQVVELMGKGLSRAEISDRLGVSCFLFSLAAACRAFVWIAADSRHG